MIETVKSLKVELLSVKADNECILKAQEELNNVILNKLLSQEEIKKKEPINQPDETASYKWKSRRIDPLGSDSSSANGDQAEQHKNETKNSSEPNHSESWKDKRKCRYNDEITGEFNKIKAPTFNGEVETGEEVEAWLFGMTKYFQIYNYSSEMKARITIYNLTGKADIWWQDVKGMK